MGITSQRSKSGVLTNHCRIELHFSTGNCEVPPKLAGVQKNSVLTAHKGNNFIVAAVGTLTLGMERMYRVPFNNDP